MFPHTIKYIFGIFLVTCYVTGYNCGMIVSFRHKGLERFFVNGDGSKLQPSHLPKIRRILAVLNTAKTIHDVNHPGWGLHSLKGNLRNHWAVKVNGNWRITFRFEGERVEVLDIDYLDYH